MHDWIDNNNVEFAVYFEYDGPDGEHRLSNNQFPKSAAKFVDLFGPSAPAPSPSNTPAPAPTNTPAPAPTNTPAAPGGGTAPPATPTPTPTGSATPSPSVPPGGIVGGP